jgi:hypothetical protein
MFGRANNRNEKRKKVDRSRPAIPIFRGEKERIDKYDISKASPESDFGKAYYWGLRFIPARKWATRKGRGRVEWAVFDQELANDKSQFDTEYIEDRLKWINTILEFYYDEYDGDPDIIVGDMMDGSTSNILRKYSNLADSMGIPMTEFSNEIKLQMAEELNPDHFDQQIAIRKEKAFKTVKKIGELEVDKTNIQFPIDPADVAAQVADMLMEQDGLQPNEALELFLTSETFSRLLNDPGILNLPPDKILEMYRREVGRHAR